jgi:peroxiredoxin
MSTEGGMSDSARRWLAVGLVALATYVWAGAPQGGLPEGAPAPALAVTTADGHAFALHEARGHAVVIAFWATWCPACRAEAPELGRIERVIAARGGRVLALSVDTLPLARVAAEAERLGMPASVALAPADLVARFAVTLLPTTFVIGPSGTIAHVFAGGARGDDILAAVEAAERGAS